MTTIIGFIVSSVLCTGCGAAARSEKEAIDFGWELGNIPTQKVARAYHLCYFCSQPENEPLKITCLSSLDITQKDNLPGGH